MHAIPLASARFLKISSISLAILTGSLIFTQPVFSFSFKRLIVQAEQPQLRPTAKPAEVKTEYTTRVEHLRRDGRMARRMARYHWLDKAAQANPAIVEAITQHRRAAMLVAKHPRLGYIAEADHYLCRRLTRWKSVARLLAASPQANRVIALDPEGIYSAIKRDKRTARILAKNPNFDQMIVENPDLGQLIATYM